jgi:hypothetical protein
MKRSLRSALVAGVVAAAALLGVPAAAQASIYPPAGSCTSNPATITAGATITFRCVAETFSPNEDITVTVTGENGASAKIGMVRLAITTASGHVQSEADGSIAGVTLTLPSNATGTYNIAAVSATSAGGTAPVSIKGADGTLSTPGLDGGALLGAWVGGVALLVAGVALALAAVARRRRNPR